MKEPTKVDDAKYYAICCHKNTNHLYDGQPYSVHLQSVVNYAEKFIELIPSEMRETVLCACWCHDVIEDTRQTYNDVNKELGEDVADIVYALTNEKGMNRKERANDKYYDGIRNTIFATFVKVCDRLANASYSKSCNSKMLYIYRKENREFVNYLYHSYYQQMFNELNEILKVQ